MANEKRLIDANALIELIKKEQSGYECGGYDEWINGIFLGLDKAIDEIIDAPTVDAVEVVHGRWEFEKNPYMRDMWSYRCTACDWRYTDNPRHCPNCGAKMDGGNEDGEN